MVTDFRLPLVATVASLVLAVPAQAAVFDVTRTDDPSPNGCVPGDCSLREAVIAANGVSAASTINLPAGTYHLTIGGSNEDAAATGDLDILEPTTIQGAGANVTIIDASTLPSAARDRVFDVLAAPGAVPPPGTVTFSGLTVTGGNVAGQGGGIHVSSSFGVQVVNSTISGNTSSGPGGAIEQEKSSALTITGSTISGNNANSGGAIKSTASPTTITNSTLNGNTATVQGGALDIENSGTITNATIAFNTAPAGTGGGIFSGFVQVRNSILASNTGGNCDTGAPTASLGHNIDSDNTCAFAQTGDQPGVNPQLGSLAPNGGPTQTDAIPKGSPAVDAADNSTCPSTDQRGQPRPFDGNDDGLNVCDIGAYELTGPAPTAVTGPANGISTIGATLTGTVNPGGFIASYHFDYGTTTAYGSTTPATSAGAGSAGVPVSAAIGGLAPNTTYHYRLVASGGGGGGIGSDMTFTTLLPLPVEGVAFNVVPVKGTVLIALPAVQKAHAKVAGFGPLVKLTHAAQIPIGSMLDTKHGTASLTTATNTFGGTQTGQFSKGAFIVQQPHTNPLTTAVMTGSNLNACSKLPHGGAKKPIVGARSRRSRSLFANVHGRFRTRGRNSTATVRGTEFLVKDTCAGTTTTVKRGVVSVRDFTLRKTVKVKAHHKYLARAPKRRHH